MEPVSNKRLLVFNCHEAWVYQLRALPCAMDVIVDLPGRAIAGWDSAMRPLPPNARCINLQQAQASRELYECIVAHSLTDLLDVKMLHGPRLLVLHATLGGMALDQKSTTAPDDLRRALSQYVRMIGAHVMAVSRLKGRSWGVDEDVVPLSANPADYLPYRGDVPRGLRVANQIRQKTHALNWEFHERAFAGVPVTLVGRNPDIPGIEPAKNWQDLKEIFSRHRFFIHTAEPALEDGYNMATLEAMAAGLPVLGNCHPSSPVQHGVSGFLSDDPAELRACAARLLTDRKLSARMGRKAQNAVGELFSLQKFANGITKSIATARAKWLALHNSPVAIASPRDGV